MALAHRQRLTGYDATYLELAAREVLPLATLDTALGAAAVAEGVVLLGGAVGRVRHPSVVLRRQSSI